MKYNRKTWSCSSDDRSFLIALFSESNLKPDGMRRGAFFVVIDTNLHLWFASVWFFLAQFGSFRANLSFQWNPLAWKVWNSRNQSIFATTKATVTKRVEKNSFHFCFTNLVQCWLWGERKKKSAAESEIMFCRRKRKLVRHWTVLYRKDEKKTRCA